MILWRLHILVAEPWVPLVGASAGIFGVLVAAARVAPNVQVLVMGIIPMPLRNSSARPPWASRHMCTYVNISLRPRSVPASSATSTPRRPIRFRASRESSSMRPRVRSLPTTPGVCRFPAAAPARLSPPARSHRHRVSIHRYRGRMFCNCPPTMAWASSKLRRSISRWPTWFRPMWAHRR